ncbi:MAG TPA: AAA family ATPase, partial [Fibrobacteria bacterium]|nr:AAA family ATPase [Fibrobacteria bacterium]
MRSRIIAACNQKGGVGKTTTCVNLAAGLAAMEKRVLLVDMDPQANSTQGLGFDEGFENDIYDALLLPESEVTPERVRGFVQKSGMPYLDLFPCSRSLAGLEVKLLQEDKRERRLKRVLDAIRADYDFILIDSPPSLNILKLNVLTAADT